MYIEDSHNKGENLFDVMLVKSGVELFFLSSCNGTTTRLWSYFNSKTYLIHSGRHKILLNVQYTHTRTQKKDLLHYKKKKIMFYVFNYKLFKE